MHFIVEQTCDKALAGPGERILGAVSAGIHQRTTVIMGSREEVDRVFRT